MARRKQPARMRLSGWRRTAAINTAAILVVFFSLIGCLAWSLYRTGGLHRVFILLDGQCDRSRQINLLLHLATNAISTIILASSNFFMQVLTSPSREEVDRAHANGRSLDIGVQSLMNFGQLRKRKLVSWSFFVIGSLPFHIFANSVIFGTDDGRSRYTVLYATEAFVQGGPYFPLGAALTPARHTPWSDYTNPSSNLRRIIEKAWKEAAMWEYMDTEACSAHYLSGMPLRDRQDVVMIVDSDGWTTADLWDLNSTQAKSAAVYVPSDQPNTLLSTQVSDTHGISLPSFLEKKDPSTLVVSLSSRNYGLLNNGEVDLFGREAEYGYTAISYNDLLRPSPPPAFPVRYCLAEPVLSHCKVAVSLPILLIVAITTLVKLSQCAVVLITFRHENPLVTLGDAIESFLDRQDVWTCGCCTYGWRDFRSSGGLVTGARQWKKTKYRWSSAMPKWLQAVYYSVMLAALGGAAGLYYLTTLTGSASEVFGPGPTNPLLAEGHMPHGSVVTSALIANAPQVVLSICYLCYNTLFTRFLLAKR